MAVTGPLRLLLIEGKIKTRRLKTLETFASAMQAAETGACKIAFVLEAGIPDAFNEFFDLVASNRGLQVKYFTEKCAACEWLLKGSNTCSPTAPPGKNI